MSWMAWILPTVLFFVGIAVLLVGMTLVELRWPCVERKGFLLIIIIRGDRLFIGLFGSVYLYLLVIGVTDWSVWIVSLFIVTGKQIGRAHV